MAISDAAHALGSLRASALSRTIRTKLDSPAMKVLGVLLVLVLLGMVTGQIVGHLLATGIESLLGVVDANH